MEISVYNYRDLVVGILYFSLKGLNAYKSLSGGEGLKEAFERYRYPNSIPFRFGGETIEFEDKISRVDYARQVSFGDKKYLTALDEVLCNYGEFTIYRDEKSFQELQAEYEENIESVADKAA